MNPMNYFDLLGSNEKDHKINTAVSNSSGFDTSIE